MRVYALIIKSPLWFRINDGQDHGEEVGMQFLKPHFAMLCSYINLRRHTGRAKVRWVWWKLLHGRNWATHPVLMVSRSPSPETHCTNSDARMFVTSLRHLKPTSLTFSTDRLVFFRQSCRSWRSYRPGKFILGLDRHCLRPWIHW